MLPPIRYPLPSLLALILAGLLTWQGAEWTRAWRARMAARVELALAGPPVPRSRSPQVVAGSIRRQGLLLKDMVVAAERPNGTAVETFDRRSFVDIYDTWPGPGPITHYRVGNRRPVGWIKASEILPWSSRLVIRPPSGKLDLVGGEAIEVGSTPLPVVGGDGRTIEVALWAPGRAWSGVDRVARVAVEALPAEAWGVLISQVELPVLLRQALEGEPSVVRARALIGRFSNNQSLTPADAESSRKFLPAPAFAIRSDPKTVVDRLARANSVQEADVAWSGLSFRFLPIADLP